MSRKQPFELEDIRKAGLDPKLLVSERCQILMPYHILLDEYEEERLGKAAFGSTKSGIAPFFSDKYAKIGIQVNELFFLKNSVFKKQNRLGNQIRSRAFYYYILHNILSQ